MQNNLLVDIKIFQREKKIKKKQQNNELTEW